MSVNKADHEMAAKLATLTPLERRVYDALKGKRLKSDAIAAQVRSRADSVRRALRALKKKGFPIVSTRQGATRSDAPPPP